MFAPQSMQGLYRAPNAREWQPIEIVGQYPNGKFLVQEVGRPLPGRFIASRNDLRVPVTQSEAA
jgi:hypothetical protein